MVDNVCYFFFCSFGNVVIKYVGFVFFVENWFFLCVELVDCVGVFYLYKWFVWFLEVGVEKFEVGCRGGVGKYFVDDVVN